MKVMKTILLISCMFIWGVFLQKLRSDVNGLQETQAQMEIHQKHLAGEEYADQNYIADRIYAQYAPQLIVQYRGKIFADVILLIIQTVSCVIVLVDELRPALQKKEGEHETL